MFTNFVKFANIAKLSNLANITKITNSVILPPHLQGSLAPSPFLKVKSFIIFSI